MDKHVLEDYMDACVQIKETKQALLKLKKKRKRYVQDAVKGSSHDFPFTVQTFRIEGISRTAFRDSDAEDRLKNLLEERLQKAECIKRDVEAWMNTIPMRMQRIIRYRVFEEMRWNQVAERMGRGTTEASVKMEFQRFMGKK